MWFRFFAILAVLPHSAHIDIQQPNLNLLLLSPVSEVLAFAHMYSVQGESLGSRSSQSCYS